MLTLKKCWQAIILTALFCLPLAGCVQVSAATEPTDATASAAVCYMDTLPGNWSIESPQTPEKEYLRQLTAPSLYTVTGGDVTSGIAALPEDVTAAYRGTYGVPADADRGYAFRITLDSNACWEDGAEVSADDVLFTVETLLNSESCAADYLWLAGAEEFTQGWERETEKVVSLEDAGFDSVSAAREAGYSRFYVDLARFWGLEAGWSGSDSRVRVLDYAMPAGLNEMYVTAGYLYRQYLADGASYDYLQPEFVGVSAEPENRMTMEDVGLLKTGDKEFVVIAREPVTAAVVTVRLSKLCLLVQELHVEAYGASAGTYSAYGPYRIVSASAEEIVLERNAFWRGDTAAYPADRIVCRAG